MWAELLSWWRKEQFIGLDLYVRGPEGQLQSTEMGPRLICEKSWAWWHMAVVLALRRRTTKIKLDFIAHLKPACIT